MQIWTKSRDDIYIIEISGRMDTISSKEVEEKLEDAIDHNNAKIIIDLAGVDYISSVGLRVLLAALKKQRELMGSMKLVSLQPFVKDIFRMTGFDRIFSISSNQEEAIEGFFRESSD
ncbi:MAG: STAS domain-containing protein [Methanothrix sp.]